MLLRNGLLSTLRAKGRTALFTLLILVLTITLALGLGMWAYCDSLLTQMEEYFTSVALVEYIGASYPDENAADQWAREALEALDDEAMSAVDGVTLWEHTQGTLVSIDGLKNPSADSPYESYGVVVATISPEYGTAPMPVDESDLPESMALYHYEMYEDAGGDYGHHSYCTLCLPGLEPLDLPFIDYYETDDSYRWGSEDMDPEDLSGPYVLYGYGHDEWWNSWTYYEIVGELPDGYDREAMKDLLWNSSYSRYGAEDPYRYENNYGKVLSPGSTGRVSKTLYVANGKDSFMCRFSCSDPNFTPEEGKKYLLNVTVGSSVVSIVPFPNSDETPWLELSGDDDPALTEGVFAEHAEFYRLANNTSTLTASDSVQSLEIFQQGTLYLTDGRFPAAGEAGACVVSGATAEKMELGIGDTIDLEILDSGPWDRGYVSQTGDRRTLEIVGITNPSMDYMGQVWTSAAEGGFDSPLFGYTLGIAALENEKAVQAAEELTALLPPTVRLTMYDQGYAAAARPIQAMRTASEAITAAAALGTLAVLVLFAFLFVGRQRETVGVLVSLGTPGGKIRAWLLSGAAAISGAAALVGALVGSLALQRVVDAALSMFDRLYATDTRYSEAAIGLIREAPELGAASGWPAAVAGVAVFAAALLLCLVFLRHARKENAPKRGKVTVRVPKGRTSVSGRGALRFAALSARRGGRRSAVVVAAALVLALFVSLLAVNAQSWSGQIDALYADSKLQGQIVSLNGRKQTGLVVPLQDVQALWKSDLLSDISVSLNWRCTQTGEGAVPSIYQVYPSSEGYLQQQNMMAQLPAVEAVNSLSAAEEFYYTDRPEIQWLEGWDESFLADGGHPSVVDGIYACQYEGAEQAPDVVYPALASSSFLAGAGLELGDTVYLKIYISYSADNKSMMAEWPVKLQVVGSFVPNGTKDNFYVPLGLWCGPEWVHGDGDAELADREMGVFRDVDGMRRWMYYRTTFKTCRFTLRSAYELEDLRDFLADNKYSQVGITNDNRITILLRDESFTETVGGLGRYVSFSRILFPVLFLVVGLLGFIISWLTVSSRRMELAIMRGLGASPKRAFGSFFLEQAALCLTGCLVGVLAMAWLYPGRAVWLAGAGFLACYLAGCALSVLAAGRTNLMLLLSERE